MIVYGDEVAAFVSHHIETELVKPYTAIGRAVNGKIVAGVVFNCWTGPDIEITVAAEGRGMSRQMLRACASYVFDELKCERASITTEQQKVIALAHRLGAKPEGLKRNAFGQGRDATTLGILKSEWSIR